MFLNLDFKIIDPTGVLVRVWVKQLLIRGFLVLGRLPTSELILILSSFLFLIHQLGPSP